jgi:NitT/TauT family transport system permease protein
MPGLVWNTMMSMSGGWFFVVASEAITVGNTTGRCPASAPMWRWRSSSRTCRAVGWAILAMLVVILPTTSCCSARWWPGRRNSASRDTAGATARPLDAALLRRTRLLRVLSAPRRRAQLRRSIRRRMRLRLPRAVQRRARRTRPIRRGGGHRIWLAAHHGAGAGGLEDRRLISPTLQLVAMSAPRRLGLITLLRVVVLMIAGRLIWVPIGVWIGLRPLGRAGAADGAVPGGLPGQPAVPALRGVIVRFHLNPISGSRR